MVQSSKKESLEKTEIFNRASFCQEARQHMLQILTHLTIVHECIMPYTKLDQNSYNCSHHKMTLNQISKHEIMMIYIPLKHARFLFLNCFHFISFQREKMAYLIYKTDSCLEEPGAAGCLFRNL